MHIAIAIGTGALGALLGVWIAWSQSAVAITALPLIFGIVGGAGGYSLIKLDLTKPANVLKVRAVSTALASLCLACLVCLSVALIARPALLTMLHAPGVDVSTARAPLRALTMRARLEALGASSSEIARILGPTISGLPADETFVANVTLEIQAYINAYDALGQNDRTTLENEGFRDDSRELYVAAKLLQIELKALAALGDLSSQHLAVLIDEKFAGTVPRSNPSDTPDDVEAVLLENPAFVAAKVRLFVLLSDAGGSPLAAESDLKAADKLIQALGGTVEQDGFASVIAQGPGRLNF